MEKDEHFITEARPNLANMHLMSGIKNLKLFRKWKGKKTALWWKVRKTDNKGCELMTTQRSI